MSDVIEQANASRNINALLLSAARAAGPLCLNMLLWGAAKVGDRDAVRVLLAEGADREWCKPGGRPEDLSPLCVAAKEGHREAVQEMLSTSNGTRTREAMAIKALHIAAWWGHEDTVEALLEEVPREVLRGCDEASRALMKAARVGHRGIVERLLAAGLDVDAESDGCTPLQEASLSGRFDVVDYLLTAGADVNKETESVQSTPLSLATITREREVVKLLLSAGAEVDKSDEVGNFPLLAECMRGDSELIKLLVDAGAKVDKMRDRDGVTPLMAAANQGHRKVVQLLVDAGATVDKADRDGRTALFFGLDDHMEAVQLLLDRGADLDRAVNCCQGLGATRLHWASKVGLLGMVRSLLDAGADVNRQDFSGETPLHWAARGGNDCSAVAELLLASGAEVDKGSSILTFPLTNAAAMGNPKVCSVLLRAGADINNDTNEVGRNAICVAASNSEFDAALLLMQWEPSLTGLDEDDAEALGIWLAEEVRAKEAVLQEIESEMDNLNLGIEEWCNAAAGDLLGRGGTEG